MKKMPCLFVRDFSDKRRPVLLPELTPGCEWVLAGEGVPTRKRDGTACMVRDGLLYKRYDAKRGKTPPVGFVPCQPEPDPVTGHHPGWIAVGDEPESKWHREAWTGLRASDGSRFREPARLEDGTYELCGPRLQTNPERFEEHVFVRHGSEVLEDVRIAKPEPDVDILWLVHRDFLLDFEGEGIVYHHPDGRMCKIRRDDYGLPWPITRAA